MHPIMNSIRLALAQINPIVGDFPGNAALLIRAAMKAWEAGADVLVTPELVMSGYPAEDLVLKRHFLEDCSKAIDRLAAELPSGLTVVVGTPLAGANGKARNAAVVLRGGKRLAVYVKQVLPNFGVFDEQRVFEPGGTRLLLRAGDGLLAVHICEDGWHTGLCPATQLDGLGVGAVLNLSASPYHRGKHDLRREIFHKLAARVGAPVALCNLVGGQDELVFDGGSFVIGVDGVVTACARMFEEDLLVADLCLRPAAQHPADAVEIPLRAHAPLAPRVEAPLDAGAEVYAALVTGLRDYVGKNRFKHVVVGLSGGIDSALVAAVAVDALGADRVTGVTMPSKYSSGETRSDAELVARNLGIEFREIPIRGLYDAYVAELSPQWPGRAPDVTEENLQARIRGNILMALSNKFGWLVLTTGNKSETAVGYCTLYGDMAGGFAVIKDVPKTLVFDLCRWRNRSAGREIIPQTTIDRPPTAELRENQKDSDSLPEYPLLDAILERCVELDQGLDEIAAAGFDRAVAARVLRLVDLAEYKRRQAAPGVKITPKAFGRDRRIPITHRYQENP